MVPVLACTTVLTAAKSAYDTQIRFMRRGLPLETAKSLYAEFIANLATKAWETGPMGSPFGDVCLPDEYLDQLQNENGTLLRSVSIDAEIAGTGAQVPLMTDNQLDSLAYPTNTADSYWAQTSAYLMEDIPLALNISRLHFPSESTVRVDPYQDDACYQFEQRYNITGLSTVKADVWTATVFSLVLTLIDMGANATKAVQLLKHAAAYSYVGMRCKGLQKSELDVPTYFLKAYARQSAWLSKNKSVVVSKDASAMSLMLSEPELIQLLSSYSSGGSLPRTIITANGHLQNMTYNWTSSADATETSRKAAQGYPNADRYFETVESSVNAAISASIATKNDLAFSISRKLQRKRPFRAISEMNDRVLRAVSGLKSNPRASRKILGLKEEEVEVFELIPSIRQTCGSGWVFFSRPGVPNWTEQCCASICIIAAQGLSQTDAALFTEECCNACNEYSCTGGEQAAAEGAADIVGIELPPYGGNGNESVPVMI